MESSNIIDVRWPKNYKCKLCGFHRLVLEGNIPREVQQHVLNRHANEFRVLLANKSPSTVSDEEKWTLWFTLNVAEKYWKARDRR